MPVAKPAWPNLHREHPLAQGLVFALPMHEGGGTTLNNLAGTAATATITDTADVSWDKGQSGYAVKCAATAATTVGVTVAKLISTTVYTIVTGIRRDGAGELLGSVFSQAATAGLYINSSGQLDWFIGVTDNLSLATIPTDGASHQGAVSVNDTAIQFYIDGVTDAPATTSATLSLAVIDTMFNDNASETFVGALDYLYVYNRILSAAEIKQLHEDPFQMFRRPSSARLKRAAVPGVQQMLAQMGCGA